jgi:hypothetical protein
MIDVVTLPLEIFPNQRAACQGLTQFAPCRIARIRS